MTSTTTIQRLMDSSGTTGADRAFSHHLMATLAIPVFVLDTTSRVMLWNRACERLTGVPAREIIGTRDHWRSFFEERRPTLADMLIEDRAGEAGRIQPRSGGSACMPVAARVPDTITQPIPRTGKTGLLP